MAAAFVLIVFLPVLPCFAAGVSEGRAAVAQFDAELKIAFDAHAQNDDAAFEQHQKKAQEYLKQGRDLYDKAGAAASDDVEILREYGAVLTKSGDYDLAAEALRRATGLAPDDAGLWRELGRALALMGHGWAREAVQALRKSIEIDPGGAEAAGAYAGLGRVYRQEGLYDLARESFEKALGLDPNCLPAKSGRIGSNVQEGAVREAADDLDKLGALPPEYAAQLPNLLSESLTRFQESRRWFADTAENHIAYAKILFRVGRMGDALEAAERSAKLGPGDYAAWNFIGDLSFQLDRRDRAREAYTRSLELKPDQPMTKERLQSLDQQSPVAQPTK